MPLVCPIVFINPEAGARRYRVNSPLASIPTPPVSGSGLVGLGLLQAYFSASALSVRSQGISGSLRPICPYAARP
jgi:hypothetical protein